MRLVVTPPDDAGAPTDRVEAGDVGYLLALAAIGGRGAERVADRVRRRYGHLELARARVRHQRKEGA